jgi:hypothetical protein
MTSVTIAGRSEPAPRAWAGLAAAGLYLPSFEPGHAEHDLTQKIRQGKIWREHDEEFAELLAGAAVRHFPDFRPDLIVSVPERSGGADRFRSIRSEVARRVGATDAGSALRQRRFVEGYRRMTRAQRRASCVGRFLAQRSISGSRVLLIDDVVTSGYQAREAIRALRAAGARDWRVVAVARATAVPGDAGSRARSGICSADREEPDCHEPDHCGVSYDHPIADRVIHEIIAFEALQQTAPGSRRAVVRWSDGAVGEALRWYDDEVLFCEGDLIGRSEAALRSLHFRRDRDYLRRDPH